uniref:Uncharacterized protein n=1 Tax=viral metagenome TaxID=1070528 RepID=A0A6M3LLT5_9ZZZZ
MKGTELMDNTEKEVILILDKTSYINYGLPFSELTLTEQQLVIALASTRKKVREYFVDALSQLKNGD